MNVSNVAISSRGRIIGLLGPTNTGKTRTAVDRMLTHFNGVIGFPLRLLARENYDRLVEMKGPQAVALLTGEEKIIPPHARYFICTVEAMPVEQEFDFLAVDEIQLCGDPDRGHVFTDRLLRARGRVETLFLGAETIRPMMQALVPNIEFDTRERFSNLTYTGFKKMTRLPKRSAVVAFSIDEVYNIAELIRRQRGGTAVVLGALSPRTRNKQVEMYQSGEVDFMVATDAIGMGLNMDIHHIALAGMRKFDGERPRYLNTAELAQIAGRAGRHTRDGTFGVTGRVRDLDPDSVEAIQDHRFEPLPALFWRNSNLDFASPKALLRSLDMGPGNPSLLRGRESDDYRTLAAMAGRDSVLARAGSTGAVRLLWDVCQIPDFRKTLNENHQSLVEQVYLSVMEQGTLPEDWVSEQISRLEKVEGDVDTLMARIAHIRTWTYITHKSEWLKDAAHWQGRTLAIEDRLSDALHEGLMNRFVDRRAAVLLRSQEGGAALLAGVRNDGTVIVEGHEVGRLNGFRFIPDGETGSPDMKAIMTVARNALRPEIQRRIGMILNSQPKQLTLTDDGQVLWQTDASNPLPGQPVATLRKGSAQLKPEVDLLDSDLLQGQDKVAVVDFIKAWLDQRVNTVLEPLMGLLKEEGIEGQARGIAFQLHEALGILPRQDLEDLITGLDPEARKVLRQRKVRLGPVLVFVPELNKPAAVKLRALLWWLWHDRTLPAPLPKDGVVSMLIADGTSYDPDYQRAIGYPVYGGRAIRVDMLDRLISAIYDNAKDGTFKATHAMAEWMGCSIPDLYKIIESMGHRKTFDPAEQPVVVAEPAAVEAVASEASEAVVAVPAEAVPEVTAETVAAVPVAAPAKPELATFRLKRGKANEAARPQRSERPEKRAPRAEGTEAGERQDRPAFRSKDKPKYEKPRDGYKGKRDKVEKFERKQTSFEAKPTYIEDSPFAVLQQLKSGMKDK